MSDENIDLRRRMLTKYIGGLVATPILQQNKLLAFLKGIGATDDSIAELVDRMSHISEENFATVELYSSRLIHDLAHLQIYSKRFNINPLSELQDKEDLNPNDIQALRAAKPMLAKFPVLKKIAPEKRMEAATIVVAEMRKKVIEYADSHGIELDDFIVGDDTFFLYEELTDQDVDAVGHAILEPFITFQKEGISEAVEFELLNVIEIAAHHPPAVTLPTLPTQLLSDEGDNSEHPQLEVDAKTAKHEEPFCGPMKPEHLQG